jgi:hypothetical protein
LKTSKDWILISVRLHNALEEAAQYEELYLNLREEHGVLVEQEAMAQREMDKLSQQNAEVLGHVNGDQRINYVESLRREMAITKQAGHLRVEPSTC